MSISYAVFCLIPLPPRSTLFPYTTLFRSGTSLTAYVLMNGPRSAVAVLDGFPFISKIQNAAGATPSNTVGPGSDIAIFGDTLASILKVAPRSEEHTSELQSHVNLVCRLLLDPATTEIYPLSLHDALPIWDKSDRLRPHERPPVRRGRAGRIPIHL